MESLYLDAHSLADDAHEASLVAESMVTRAPAQSNMAAEHGNSFYSALRTLLDRDPKVKTFTPMLCVYGSQNVGKSATLNHIIGHVLFPSDGSGLCTLCPIVVTLVNVPDLAEPVGSVRSAYVRPITGLKLDELVKAIMTAMNQTASRAGQSRSKGAPEAGATRAQAQAGAPHITHEPVYVEFRASDVVNLTITDLPGQIINTVAGMHPSVKDEVQALLLKTAYMP